MQERKKERFQDDNTRFNAEPSEIRLETLTETLTNLKKLFRNSGSS